jgi:hypothetical protein
MWEQKPEDMDTINTFFRSTLAAMWSKLMKLAKDKIPQVGEDRGIEHGYEAPPVSGSALQSLLFSLVAPRNNVVA